MSNVYNVRYLNECEYHLWDEFVDNSPQGNIFNKSWWMRAASRDFKILVCEDAQNIIGGIILPSVYRNYYLNPKLTPTLGVLFGDFASIKNTNRISKEVSIIKELINSLPKFRLFDYVFSDKFTNVLPFKWKGFDLDIRCTYIINNLGDLESIYSGFKSGIKTDIGKATKSGIIVRDDLSILDFFEINKRSFDRQSLMMPYTKDCLVKIDATLEEKGARKMFFASTNNGEIYGGIYLVFDKRTTHAVMMGSDENTRNVGVNSLLFWESIKFASTVSQEFNFEGSSLENIEKFIRAFGGEQKHMYRITKSSWLVKNSISLLRTQKNLLRRFKII